MFVKIKAVLREIHSDNSDNLSWARIISSYIVLNVFTVWDIQCWRTNSFLEFTANQLMLIVTVLGVKVGSKLVETAGESKLKSLDNDSNR